MTVTVSGLPPGATLSAGTNNGDGTWTLTPGQLPGLQLIPPANTGTDFTLTVTATHSEHGQTASNTTTANIHIEAMPTTPTLAVQSATGAEDSPIALHIDANLVDTDGSETLVIVIAGVVGMVLSQR